MDKASWKRYLKFLAKFQGGIPRATGTFLNNLAFEARTQSINTLSETMFVKQPGFIPRRIIVDKNRNMTSLHGQRAVVGSAKLPRFGGWESQETGRGEERDRFFTMTPRRGNKSRPAARSARLLPGKNRWTPDRYTRVVGRHKRAQAMLSHTWRTRYKQPFIMHGHERVKSGLYKWRGNKLTALQLFNRPKRTRKTKWMYKSAEKTIKSRNIKKAWSRTTAHLARFR